MTITNKGIPDPPATEPRLPAAIAVTEEQLDEEAAAKAFDEAQAENEKQLDEGVAKAEAETETPDWAVLPANLKPPSVGTQIAFMKIPAKWTLVPEKGDRTCALWPLGETDEKLAYARSRGDMVRSVTELSKQMIRMVDGYRTNWEGAGKPGDIASFWNEIGAKGRHMIRNYYVKTHTVSDEDALDFFSNRFAVVTVQRG